jgi:CRP/FNR family transcriptional regulator, cyclic AMP receptor protein
MLKVTNIVKSSNILDRLSESDQRRLIDLSSTRCFKQDEIIFHQGENGHCLYFIRSGKIKVCSIDRGGSELVISILTSGDLLGEMSVLDGRPRSATAVAIEKTECYCLERFRFLSFLRSSPDTCIGLITMLCEHLRNTDKQLEEITFLDVSSRLARKLLELSICTYTQEELARSIGASRVMVNRVLNNFHTRGLILISRKYIAISDLRRLKLLAGHEL